MMRTVFIFIAGLLFQSSLLAEQFRSGEEQAILIELFTSQGCSSCPPADNWLTSLKNNPDLWRKYIPIAWHVDYWDYIGWKDQFAKKAYAERQRDYRRNGNINSVYTPSLLQNGQEWRSWFWSRSIKPSEKKIGVLSVDYKDDNAIIEYMPAANNKGYKLLNYNIALLQSNLLGEIDAGENRGRKLAHNFVVRQHHSVSSDASKVNIPFVFNKAKDQALAVWLSDPSSAKVIQATGGWLAE